MQTMRINGRNFVRYISVLLISCLVSTLFVSVFTDVKASAENISQQEKVDKLASELEDVSNSIQYDAKSGLATGLDVNSLVDKYGLSEANDLNKINEILNYQYVHNPKIIAQNQGNSPFMESKAFWPCMKDQLLDMVGFQAFQALARGGIQGLIERKAWQSAAKLIIRYLGDGVSLGLIASQLAWYSAKCI